jgi:hypothetical protein
MANTLRIKRRSSSGAAGVDGLTLENAELAFNEADNTLYYGKGSAGAGGTATNIIAIAGYGAYATLGTDQTITGNKTFSGTVVVATPTANAHPTTKLYVDQAISGVATAFTVAANTGSNLTITSGSDTLTVVGGTGITTAASATDTVTITNTGVISLTGTSNEIAVSASNGAVTLSLPSNVTISNNLVVTGDLTVQGNTTTLNTATLVVEDKNIVLSNVASPTDSTADGAGITILGTTNKTLNWVDATDAWTSSENLNIATGKVFQVNGVTVLSATGLGSSVVSSSLTSVGTIVTGVWNGSTIAIANGGTGSTTASDARTALGLAIGTDVQAYDAELAALAGLTSAADKLPYFTGSGTASLATLTTFGRSLIDDADAATSRTTLGLGTIAVQNANNVTITGGAVSNITIDNVTIDGGTF